jgi:hypothetical protein
VLIDYGRRTSSRPCWSFSKFAATELFRQQYATFEGYCQDRRGWERAHADRLLDGAQVVSLVSPMETDQPMMRKSKSFAPLMRQRPEAVVKLWEAVHESTVIRSCAKRRSLCWTVFRGSAFMP